MVLNQKIIIVEGITDKKRLQQVLLEEVKFICTNGTLGIEKLEELVLPYQDEDVYVLVDADEAGNRMRSMLKRELPNAEHLYTRRMYGEVAATPLEHLARILQDAHFEVDEQYLNAQEEHWGER
jgi:toprim domain protein